MRVVYKYKLASSQQVLELRRGFKVVHTGSQGIRNSVGEENFIWIELDLENAIENVVFHTFGTGHNIMNPSYKHIGSIFNGAYVWHIYQGGAI